MNSKMRVLVCVLSVLGLLIFSFGAFAQEHPKDKEHPKEHAAKEHPGAAAAVSLETLGIAIGDYINMDTALKGGQFCVYDTQAKTPLAMKLDKVHNDKLAKVSDGVYFACTDFKATNGKMYDVDFFMKSSEHGLMISEIMIHKEDGKPRYGWVEKDGTWMRQ